MNTMTTQQRTEWMSGPKKAATAVQKGMSAGAFQCDDCTAPAVAIGHAGKGTTPVASCGPCYLRRLNAERAAR